jgi:hypothetical protein
MKLVPVIKLPRSSGRPPKDPPNPNPTIAIIGSPDLKAALIEAARVNNRSITQEARARLERTFRDDDIIARLKVIESMLQRISGGR